MSLENKTENPAPEVQNTNQDVVKNLKSEFDRKLSNLAEEFKSYFSAISSQLEEFKAKPQEKGAESDVWDALGAEEVDPKKVKEEVKKELLGELEKKERIKQRQQEVLMDLYQEFPEIADTNSELTKRAVELYKKLSPEEQTIPTSYKAVVYEAARQLKVLPKSLRQEAPETSLGKSSQTTQTTRRTEMKKKDLDELSKFFIERLNPGVLKNEKRKKRFEKFKKRHEDALESGERIIDYEFEEEDLYTEQD